MKPAMLYCLIQLRRLQRGSPVGLMAVGLALAALPAGADPNTNTVGAAPAQAQATDPVEKSARTIAVNPALTNSWDRLSSTNLQWSSTGRETKPNWRQRLEVARNQRLTRIDIAASTNLVAILGSDAPQDLKRTALLELALLAEDQNELPRAQQIYSQFLAKWPDDPSMPEIILRQGLVYRRMGLHSMALGKFYAVMTACLSLPTDRLPYYQRIVLQAQTEIAETHYQSGRHQDAVEYLTRLLKQNDPALNREQVNYKLVRSLAWLRRDEEAIPRGIEFIERYPQAEELAEVRFHVASALKRAGRNSEALTQVLQLLKEQEAVARTSPLNWAYWQQRAGNEIANQLYAEGDFANALSIYTALADLDFSPSWQIPVWYQVGITYERLEQPVRAVEFYDKILARRTALGEKPAPTLQTLLEMAQWRKDFLQWQQTAEQAAKRFKPADMASLSTMSISTNLAKLSQ